MLKIKYLWIFVVIILLNGLLRFAYIDRIPSGISDDELDYVLTSKSIYLSGKTLDGKYSPFSLRAPKPGETFLTAQTPYVLFSPFIGTVKTSLASSRIPYAVVSVLATVILFFIALRLWGMRIALLVAFVSSVNPWSVYFGRTAFEAPISVFFAYVYLLCLLYLNNWWIVLSIAPWVIGLYAYQGISIVYLPLLIVSIVGVSKLKKHIQKAPYIVLLCIGVSIYSIFIRSIITNKYSRISDISTPNNASVIAQVDTDRRKSIQTPFNPLFINKYSISAWNVMGKYIGAFASDTLFVTGESRSSFSLWTHGSFYAFEIVLLLLGLYHAYTLHKRKTILLVCFVALAPIPAALSLAGDSYALRASLLYPLFCMFIGIGISKLFDMKYKIFWRTGIALFYIIFIANFLNIYFARNPINNSEGFGFSNRTLVKYMQLTTLLKKPLLYVGNNAINPFRQYLFYNDILNKNTIKDYQEKMLHRTLSIDTLSFIECPEVTPLSLDSSVVIVPAGITCAALTAFKELHKPLVISQLSDSGRLYEIYNDALCSQYSLQDYQNMISLDDLLVEKMQAEQFCKTYISRPR